MNHPRVDAITDVLVWNTNRQLINAVTIEVSDSGPGLTRQEVEQVMQRSVSGEESNGSGLGLSIVQDALDELNGSFELISTPGVGTTARCRFPVQQTK